MSKPQEPKPQRCAEAEQKLIEALHQGFTSAKTLIVSSDGERREIAFEIRIVVEGGRILEASVREVEGSQEEAPPPSRKDLH